VDANTALGFDAELRNYDFVPHLLADMSISSIILLTNNPFKINQLEKLGVKINHTRSLHIPPQEHNVDYLKVKQFKMNHMLKFDENTGVYNKEKKIWNTDLETQVKTDSDIKIRKGKKRKIR
jgi:3,4-dihydroxy 2-butanone 4-phosphate synthase/GTP cyclohydrolase II